MACGKVFGSVAVDLLKFCDGPSADGEEGQQHVEGVKASGIHIHLCRDAGFSEIFDIGQRLAVEGFDVSHKGVGGRESPIVFQTGAWLSREEGVSRSSIIGYRGI